MKKILMLIGLVGVLGYGSVAHAIIPPCGHTLFGAGSSNILIMKHLMSFGFKK